MNLHDSVRAVELGGGLIQALLLLAVYFLQSAAVTVEDHGGLLELLALSESVLLVVLDTEKFSLNVSWYILKIGVISKFKILYWENKIVNFVFFGKSVVKSSFDETEICKVTIAIYLNLNQLTSTVGAFC